MDSSNDSQNTQHNDDSDGSVAILLIGSTGNGKSTLGNFLLDPSEEHITSKTTFAVASSSKPETKEVASRCKDGLVVIDTPGLNEGDCEDLEHMIDIVEQLIKQRSISACILCVKFETKMDTQYKATVKYYKRLLPRLFENNVLIVFTNYLTDGRSKFNRERRKVDEAVVAQNAIDEVSLEFNPAYFLIDALPYGKEERDEHEATQRWILNYIKSKMPPVNMEDLTVAKTDAVLKMDEKEIEASKGEIKGYRENKEIMSQKIQAVLTKIESKESELDVINQSKMELNAELVELEANELVTGEVWNLEQKWKLLQTQSKSFAVESEWPIAELDFWDNGKLKWTVKTKQECSISGEVKGKFMRGLYAKLTVKVRKCDKKKKEMEERGINYETKLQEIRKELSDNTCEYTRIQEEIKTIKNDHTNYEAEIERFDAFIIERKERIKIASKDSMTVDKAKEKLKKLKDC